MPRVPQVLTAVQCSLDEVELELLDSWAQANRHVVGNGRPNRRSALRALVRQFCAARDEGSRSTAAVDSDEESFDLSFLDDEDEDDRWTRPRVGDVVHVWRTYGTFMATHRGVPAYATSEKNRDDPDAVSPDEDLVVARIDADYFYCNREDGRIVRVHKNHLWRDAPYNQ